MATGSPFVALRDLGRALLTLGRTRLELFSIELEEQKTGILRAFVLSLAGLICFGMAAILFSALIAVFFWDTPYRLWAILGVGLVWAVVGAIALWQAWRGLQAGGPPFALTLQELARDVATLHDEPPVTPAARQAEAARNEPWEAS